MHAKHCALRHGCFPGPGRRSKKRIKEASKRQAAPKGLSETLRRKRDPDSLDTLLVHKVMRKADDGGDLTSDPLLNDGQSLPLVKHDFPEANCYAKAVQPTSDRAPRILLGPFPSLYIALGHPIKYEIPALKTHLGCDLGLTSFSMPPVLQEWCYQLTQD